MSIGPGIAIVGVWIVIGMALSDLFGLTETKAIVYFLVPTALGICGLLVNLVVTNTHTSENKPICRDPVPPGL